MSDLKLSISHLNQQIDSGKLLGLITIATYKGGKIEIEYNEHIAAHPAPIIGYLLTLCQDLAKYIKR